MTDLTKLVVRLAAEIGDYVKGLNEALLQTKSFQKATDDALNKVTGAFAAFFAVDKAVEWGKSILENADHLAKFSQSTGVSVESLSRLQYGLKASGVEAEGLDGIFRKLNQNIDEASGNATSNAAAAFDLLGINVHTATGQLKTADQLLPEIADKFAAAADGANKVAIATALGGKSFETAIPFLNQGAAGIQKLNDESDALGATLSGKLARDTEEFVSQLGRFKTIVVDGIGNRIASQVIPVFKNLSDSFGDAKDKTEALDRAATVAVTGLKLLATAGLYIVTEFDKAGEVVGGAAAALVAIAHGRFSEAAAIFKDNDDQLAKIEEEFQKRYAGIWKEGGAAVANAAEDTGRKAGKALGDLSAKIQALQDAKKATEELKGLLDTINASVASFGLGEAALVRYRLEQGNLVKSVHDAGAAGLDYKKKIEAAADALQRLKDTKDIVKSLADVNAEIVKLSGAGQGDTAAAEFDAKYAEIIGKARRQGNTELEQRLELLLKLQVAQGDFNDLQTRAAAIDSDLAIEESRINNAVVNGQLTELDGERQLSEARQKAVGDLASIRDAQASIAKQTGNAQQAQQVKELTSAMEDLNTKSKEVANTIRKGFEDDAANSLLDFETGIKSAGEAVGDFLDNIAKQLLELANKQIAQGFFNAVLGDGSSGGGFFGKLVGAFSQGAASQGGGRADGGPVSQGMAYKVNENTPNSEWFVPSTAGHIMPASAMANTTVHQQFLIQAPQGSVSRQTQLQIGVDAARGISTAQRRNG